VQQILYLLRGSPATLQFMQQNPLNRAHFPRWRLFLLYFCNVAPRFELHVRFLLQFVQWAAAH